MFSPHNNKILIFLGVIFIDLLHYLLSAALLSF